MNVSELVKLGEKSLTMFDMYISERHITSPNRVYIKYTVNELEILETGSKYQGNTEIIQKPDFSKIIYDFIKEMIEPTPEFQKLNESIAKKYKKNINIISPSSNEIAQSAYWLESFIRRLIVEKLEGSLLEDSIIEYASLFKSELDLSSLEYKYVEYLDAVYLEDDSIRINDTVLIRKTQKSDLNYTRDIFFEIPGSGFPTIPLSVLEFNIIAKNEKECYDYINRIFNSLRLYKLGSVHSIKSHSTKKTIIWPGSQVMRGFNNIYASSNKYSIKATESDIFIKFINTLEQKLNFDPENKDYRALNISIERYISALLESVDVDRKLMTAVMGLESLYTLDKERGENTFKLAIRVAKLLGHLTFDSIKVRELTGQAYNFRNTVVHGAYIPPLMRENMNEIFPIIINYLRVSLVIFLLNPDVGKYKMIEMIDRSLINDSQNIKLKEILDTHIGEFMPLLI
jgi:hypothetical protein